MIFMLSGTCFPQITATIDPLDIGVGTRALGMGKAYVGAADDANCIFLNPAGLAQLHNWGATSMYCSLISEITYNSFAIYGSRGDEAFGLGYVGANISGTLITTYRDPSTGRIVPLNVYPAGYSDSVLLFSYGVSLGKYFNAPVIDKTLVGISFKTFLQTLKSSEEMTASGFNLDLGLIYPVNSWLRAGLYAQNILPDSAGGALRWDSGEKESIPSNYKLGLNFKVLGSEAIWDNPNDLFANLDLEQGAKYGRPTVYHMGLEWWPYAFMALRCGIDQDVYAKEAGNGVDNNLTLGLGLWYGDIGFDYAYHQYGPLTDNITHYFSLSYGYPKVKPVPVVIAVTAEVEKPKAPETKDYITITGLQDKLIVYSPMLDISGDILTSEVADVDINGDLAVILNRGLGYGGNYSMTYIIKKYGKLPVIIKCLDENKRTLREYKFRLLRIVSFMDVKEGYWAKDAIVNLATFGFVGGFPDSTFKPEKTISRAELTTILVKATGMQVPPVQGKVFSDVSDKHWAAKYIKLGVDRGIVTGYRDKTFKPSNSLNRVEGLMMIARFAGIKPVEELKENPFPDVSKSHWAAKTIQAAKDAGLLKYLAGGNFDPNKPLTRAEAAQILSQTQVAKDKTAELYNWDAGFWQ